MSVLLYIIIAIAALVLMVVALFYLAKGLLAVMCWFVRLLPTLIKAAIYSAILLLIYSILNSSNYLPSLPAIVYPLLYFVLLGLILVRKYFKYGSIFGPPMGDYKNYVLNKKSKVIHEKYSDSEETISSHHRKELSYSEAVDLVNNKENYRFKK